MNILKIAQHLNYDEIGKYTLHSITNNKVVGLIFSDAQEFYKALIDFQKNNTVKKDSFTKKELQKFMDGYFGKNKIKIKNLNILERRKKRGYMEKKKHNHEMSLEFDNTFGSTFFKPFKKGKTFFKEFKNMLFKPSKIEGNDRDRGTILHEVTHYIDDNIRQEADFLKSAKDFWHTLKEKPLELKDYLFVSKANAVTGYSELVYLREKDYKPDKFKENLTKWFAKRDIPENEHLLYLKYFYGQLIREQIAYKTQFSAIHTTEAARLEAFQRVEKIGGVYSKMEILLNEIKRLTNINKS